MLDQILGVLNSNFFIFVMSLLVSLVIFVLQRIFISHQAFKDSVAKQLQELEVRIQTEKDSLLKTIHVEVKDLKSIVNLADTRISTVEKVYVTREDLARAEQILIAKVDKHIDRVYSELLIIKSVLIKG